jgi:hypothetical protein
MMRYLVLRTVVACTALTACLVMVAQPAAAQDSRKGGALSEQDMKLRACGPMEKEVDFDANTDKKTHPTPKPPTDRALVYVLRPSMLGNKVQTKLAVDGEWKGVNRGNNYFFFTLDPGEHHFCSVAENYSLLSLNVEAGKTYFVQQHVRIGLLKAQNKIDVMTNEEGQRKLSDANLAIWTAK